MDKRQATKIVAFATMSDGNISRPNRKDRSNNNVQCYFRFGQVIGHEDFVDYIRTGVEYFTRGRVYTYNRKGDRKDFNEVVSNRHPTFTKLWERLYIMGHKTVDPHYLKDLDWEALAILFMSDGHGRFKGKTSDFTLNMCRLSYGEYGLLKKYLKKNLNLEWNINRSSGKYYVLRLLNSSFPRFEEGIKNYILPSFRYKLYPNE